MSSTPFDRVRGRLNHDVVVEINKVYSELKSQRKTAKHLGITEHKVRTALDAVKVLEQSRPNDIDEDGNDTFSLKEYQEAQKPNRRTTKKTSTKNKTKPKNSNKKKKSKEDKPLYAGAVGARRRKINPLPKKGKVKRYLLTCAQNNTPINKSVWNNIKALSEHYDAEIMVSCFTYNHNAFGTLSVKPNTKVHQSSLWYDEAILDYVSDETVELAPSLVWCGEMNNSPTAVNVFTGLTTYTGIASSIIPHTKIALESVATPKDMDTKIMYSTGTVTQRNYIHKKAGLKADFHHAYGCMIAEVMSDGTWFVRQVNANDIGTLHDLDVKVSRGKVTTNNTIEAVSWGDVHVDALDPTADKLAWGENGIMDTLRPKHQFLHDVFDMKVRNHHSRDKIFLNINKVATGRDVVEDEVERCAAFIKRISRRFCKSVVVDSNHDLALAKWVEEVNPRNDPTNALYHSTLFNKMAQVYTNDEQKNFHLLEWVMREKGISKDVKFLRTDELYVVKDIECGMHGHRGKNGSKGGLAGFSKLPIKSIIGHSHSAGISNGCYQNGYLAKKNLGYNEGPSSWSWSSTIIYPNGKRAIITFKNGLWRA